MENCVIKNRTGVCSCDAAPVKLIDRMRNLRADYKIPDDWTPEQVYKVLSVRYELELRSIDGVGLENYTLATDVDAQDLASVMSPAEALGAGEVGYLTASIKTISDTRVGDTVTGVQNPAKTALPGYKQAQPMVFSGVYPADGSKYGDLRDALEKLKLNDASMTRCGRASGC